MREQRRLVGQQLIETAIQRILRDQRIIAKQIRHRALLEPLPMQAPFAASFLVRLLETIATRAGVTNKLAADRRWIDANRPRDVSLRVAALQKRTNLAALFAGQMEIV